MWILPGVPGKLPKAYHINARKSTLKHLERNLAKKAYQFNEIYGKIQFTMVAKITDKTTDEKIAELTLQNKEYYLYLMRRYEPKLLRYIFRITNATPQDAEDILQEVFLKAYLNLNDFDRALKFSSWIYRICHNEVISYWRKKSSVPKNVELFDNDIKLSSDAPIWEELDDKLNKKKIAQILRKLPLRYREVLVLRYFEDKEYAEIADILKTPIGTVGTLISRAKIDFKKESENLKIKF